MDALECCPTYGSLFREWTDFFSFSWLLVSWAVADKEGLQGSFMFFESHVQVLKVRELMANNGNSVHIMTYCRVVVTICCHNSNIAHKHY
jgi:hypothetical protein